MPDAPEKNNYLPRESVLLAFDYGEVRIGIAIGNTLTRQARALTVLANTTVTQRFSSIGQLIELWQPNHLVVGLPCYSDGTPHHMTQRAIRFGNQLQGRFALPVSWVDERYSSTAARSHQETLRYSSKSNRIRRVIAGQPPHAEEILQPSKAKVNAIDAEAARIILQQFFDTGENLTHSISND